MAKNSGVALFAVALCFSSLLSLALATTDEHFFVEGKVYCDTCRVQFETKLSEYLQGAKVALECRKREGGDITYTQEAITGTDGKYKIAVQGNHEEEICEVKVEKSPRDDCGEIVQGRNRARVVLTNNNGVAQPVRFANSLGFLKNEPVAGCRQVLIDLGFIGVQF
ncbi:hypothetical protein SLA2020_222300 [Shorea laevis]